MVSLIFGPHKILILGHNMIKFNFDTSQPGRFSVSRFCLHYSRRNQENDSSSRVEFVSDILSPTVHLEILNNPPVITMGKVHNPLIFTRCYITGV